MKGREKMRTLTPAAQTSKVVKKMLKEKYPSIKFTVRSKNFAGGDSVDISWNLGPRDKEIENLVSQYEYGHFNGMIDLYEYSNCRNDIPQAKFVCTQRDYKSVEEIENYKLPYQEQKDLYGEGETLIDNIAKQICKLVNIGYGGSEAQVPTPYQVCYAGGGTQYLTWNNLVYQLLNETTFDTDTWDGYKVDFDYDSFPTQINGQHSDLLRRITNKFRIIKS